MIPSATPSARPTVCFNNNGDLKNAVSDYIDDPTPGSAVAATYGWPIGTWCVSGVTDMKDVFKGHQTFNEDISGWDVSNVVIFECKLP